jgi:hypothetical protein
VHLIGMEACVSAQPQAPGHDAPYLRIAKATKTTQAMVEAVPRPITATKAARSARRQALHRAREAIAVQATPHRGSANDWRQLDERLEGLWRDHRVGEAEFSLRRG